MPVPWPPNVPDEFQRQGFSESFSDNVLRSGTDSGPPKRRRRSTQPERLLNGTIRMNGSELSEFKAWYLSQIASGARAFEFPDPTHASRATVTVAFTSPPSWGNIGGDEYEVELAIQVEHA